MGGVKLLGLGGGNFFVASSGKVLVIYRRCAVKQPGGQPHRCKSPIT